MHLDGLPTPRRYWAIVAIALAISMSVLDGNIVNVALPSLAVEFHASRSASIWIVNAYQVAILVALLPLAALGEFVGYRRVSQAGLAIFTLASLACALAPSLLTLSLARIVQGFGAAGIMSVNAALVRFTYPQRLLGRAVGINAFVIATSAAVGPSVASAILAVAHWRWLFAVNVPIGTLALLIAIHALPQTERSGAPPRLSAVLLNVGAFGLLISGLQAIAHDEALPLAGAQLIGGALCAVLLVRSELGRARPVIPFDLLRIRIFALSIAASVCSFGAQMTALIALPFEIQRLGHSAVETGLLMTPWPLALAVTAPVAGRLADRYPAGLLGGIGLASLALGLTLLASFPAGGTATDFTWRMALCGFGIGLFQAPNNRTLLATAPRARAGAAGGMLSTARLLGQSCGAAGVAILFRLAGEKGSVIALMLASGLALAAAALSLTRLVPHGAAAEAGG